MKRVNIIVPNIFFFLIHSIELNFTELLMQNSWVSPCEFCTKVDLLVSIVLVTCVF